MPLHRDRIPESLQIPPRIPHCAREAQCKPPPLTSPLLTPCSHDPTLHLTHSPHSSSAHIQVAALPDSSTCLSLELKAWRLEVGGERWKMGVGGMDPRTGYCAESRIYRSTMEVGEMPTGRADLVSYLFERRRGDGAVAAVVDGRSGREVTYAELEATVRVVAAGLADRLGVRKGDVVGVLSPNSIEFEVLFFAVASLGAVTSAMNPLNTEKDIRKLFRKAGAKCIFTVPALLAKAEATGLPVVLIDGDETPSSTAEKQPFLRFSDLLSASPATNSRSSVQISQEDPVAILFSSGTTGESKGVVLTHGSFIAACTVLTAPRMDGGVNGVTLLLIPMFHIFGLLIGVGNVARGSSVVLLPHFDLLEMLGAIQKYRVTAFPLVPPILLLMIKHDVVAKFDTSSLCSIGCGAAPLGKEQLEQCAARFPNAKLQQGYGLTESCAIGTSTPADGAEFADHFGSAGMLAPTLEAMVVDPLTHEAMPPTKQGELWLRGPTIMKEYVGNPKGTAETLDKEGWLRTGDLVYFDNDGYLYIVDRLKELIKYKANQVAPAELESLLVGHPAVLDAAVIPFPDDDAGEIPMAYVVRKPGAALTAEEVMKFVAEQVAPFKRIRKVAFIEAIPKSAAGKMERRKLVELSRLQSKL